VELEGHIELVASWIDSVDIATAPARMVENQAHNADKETGGLTAAGGQIERTAWHESSHAVVAHKLSLNVTRVCCRADGSGSAAYEASEARGDTILALVVATLAGIFGELLIGTDQRRKFELAHSNDVLSARLSIEAFAPGWRFASRTYAIFACCVDLSCWSEIARVAGALRLCGELDGASVRALCEPLQ
jgi:hypothetical protein